MPTATVLTTARHTACAIPRWLWLRPPSMPTVRVSSPPSRWDSMRSSSSLPLASTARDSSTPSLTRTSTLSISRRRRTGICPTASIRRYSPEGHGQGSIHRRRCPPTRTSIPWDIPTPCLAALCRMQPEPMHTGTSPMWHALTAAITTRMPEATMPARPPRTPRSRPPSRHI